jgi:hypothetical protein
MAGRCVILLLMPSAHAVTSKPRELVVYALGS